MTGLPPAAGSPTRSTTRRWPRWSTAATRPEPSPNGARPVRSPPTGISPTRARSAAETTLSVPSALAESTTSPAGPATARSACGRFGPPVTPEVPPAPDPTGPAPASPGSVSPTRAAAGRKRRDAGNGFGTIRILWPMRRNGRFCLEFAVRYPAAAKPPKGRGHPVPPEPLPPEIAPGRSTGRSPGRRTFPAPAPGVGRIGKPRNRGFRLREGFAVHSSPGRPRPAEVPRND